MKESNKKSTVEKVDSESAKTQTTAEDKTEEDDERCEWGEFADIFSDIFHKKSQEKDEQGV